MPKAATTFKNPYQFTGREWDWETGFYFYRARFYDPFVGKFLSKDPISFVGGDVNLYAYVWNNSINRIDPFGLWGIVISDIKLPLINNFIEPSKEPLSDSEIAMAFLPIGSVGKIIRPQVP